MSAFAAPAADGRSRAAVAGETRRRRVISAGLALLSVPLLLLGVVAFWSWPGQPRPYLDARGEPLEGSVSEKVFLEVNGVRQGLILKGRDATRPVLLYLHGGMPDFFLTQRFPTRLDEVFVVAWWDQRGAGLSFTELGEGERITTEQLLNDAVVVAHWLRARFGQERLYLMGHSGGTWLGMHLVQRHPELFHAFLGVAQMSNQLASEREAWAFVLEDARRRGDESLARQLERAAPTETGVPAAWLSVRDEAMHRAGVGTMRQMRSVVTGLFLESLQNRELTLREKVNLWRGKSSTGVSSMWQEMLTADLSRAVPRVDVPVYVFHGVHDLTCSYSEAVRAFDRLEAPRKGFYSFQHSAHSPLFEEPDRLLQLIELDVFSGSTSHADRPSP